MPVPFTEIELCLHVSVDHARAGRSSGPAEVESTTAPLPGVPRLPVDGHVMATEAGA